MNTGHHENHLGKTTGEAVRSMSLASALLPLLAVAVLLSWPSVVLPHELDPQRASLSQSERRLGRVPEHITEFNSVSGPSSVPRCGNVRPPEALLTPDPLLPVEDGDLLVRVSFIVGSDGHVYSAFVLNSGGGGEDEVVLRTVRHWRYRPALCNGVPTDSEARVRFSLH